MGRRLAVRQKTEDKTFAILHEIKLTLLNLMQFLDFFFMANLNLNFNYKKN